MKYKSICFDFDYTLGDATDAIVAGFHHGFQTLGQPLPDREAVRGTVGLMLEDAYIALTGDTDPVRVAQFRPLFREVAEERQKDETTLFPGAEELIEWLHAEGVCMGIVSSKSTATLQYVLEKHNLLHCFGVVLGPEGMKHAKPAPDGLNLARETLGVAQSEMLFCGDTVIDAEAAKNAGVDFCAVLNGTTPAEAFDTWPHVYIAENLDALASYLKEN